MRDFVPSEPVAPERIWKWRTPIRRFGSESTISRFGERFRDGQYSLVSFSFAVLLLTVPPPCPAICNSGGTCPRAPWSRRHCSELLAWPPIRTSPIHPGCELPPL